MPSAYRLLAALSSIKLDGFVKSPSAALPCTLRRCGVLPSMPHSSGIVRLASGAFYFAIQILTFYEAIKFGGNGDEPVKQASRRAPPAVGAIHESPLRSQEKGGNSGFNFLRGVLLSKILFF
ncbi:MAG: hypothetical protein NTY64_20805 [Deltaproteobacteria bacterium]|nr:hypothetical protein [Deltaproteobacteria bacterium]